MRRSLILAILASAAAIPASADDLFSGNYWHNGAKVRLIVKGSAVEIRFAEKPDGLAAERDTLLFNGTIRDGVLSGLARLFSKKCGSIAYTVSGPYTVSQPLFTLHGEAPIRDSNCKVTGYSSAVENAELVFGSSDSPH